MQQWKVQKDPFYGELLWQFGLPFVIEAGFFEDSAKKDDPPLPYDVLVTPTAFLKRNLTNPCILLSTGSFCPIHPGHIQMMEKAKEAVEKRGYQVAGGYFSPGHDEYIRAKTGSEWIPIHCRIDQIKEAIKPHSWLDVDPWEGIFNKVAVNFTEVIEHLRIYLKKYLQMDVPIFYVCGSDNARFVNTFKNKGHCVVINRPPYQDKFQKHYLNSERIIFAEGDIQLSSSKVRQEKPFTFPTKKKLALRLSLSNKLEALVAKHLEKYYKQITFHYVEAQRHTYKQMTQDTKTISIDTEIRGDFNLRMSRLYDVFGVSKLGYTNRPGSPILRDQIHDIPVGDYVLFDDDIHTGNTIRYAKSQLESVGHRIKSVVSLNISTPDDGEILDAKDFLFGLEETAGLVTQLPNGETCRMPYLYPYVSPYSRASILEPLDFSIEMWEMNEAIHTEQKRKVGDVPYLKALCQHLSFPEDMDLAEVCRVHVRYLKSLKA